MRNSLDITISIENEQINIDSIEIEVWDAETSELVVSSEYTDESFHFIHSISEAHKLVTIRMIVNYQMNGHDFRYTYF